MKCTIIIHKFVSNYHTPSIMANMKTVEYYDLIIKQILIQLTKYNIGNSIQYTNNVIFGIERN